MIDIYDQDNQNALDLVMDVNIKKCMLKAFLQQHKRHLQQVLDYYQYHLILADITKYKQSTKSYLKLKQLMAKKKEMKVKLKIEETAGEKVSLLDTPALPPPVKVFLSIDEKAIIQQREWLEERLEVYVEELQQWKRLQGEGGLGREKEKDQETAGEWIAQETSWAEEVYSQLLHEEEVAQQEIQKKEVILQRLKSKSKDDYDSNFAMSLDKDEEAALRFSSGDESSCVSAKERFRRHESITKMVHHSKRQEYVPESESDFSFHIPTK